MSAVKVSAHSGASLSAIPATAKKVVQDLKEIVRNSDEEIYAMLKECNMDPNEAVQRLISQDIFHEVKRKRDRKRENVNSKDSGDARSRPAGGGSSIRGGRASERAAGRGSFNSHFNSGDPSTGRGQSRPALENGVYQSTRVSSIGNTTLSSQCHIQLKPVSTATSTGTVTATVSGSSGIPNGSASYASASQGPRLISSPTSSHTTMADILKSKSSPPPVASVHVASISTAPDSVPSISFSSEVLSNTSPSAIDPPLQSFLVSRAAGPVSAVKREIGAVGNQRLIGDQGSSMSMGTGSLPFPSSTTPHMCQTMSGVSTTGSETNVSEAEDTTDSGLPSVSQEQSVNKSLVVDVVGSSNIQTRPTYASGLAGTGGTKAGIGSNTQYNGKGLYQPQQPPVSTHKVGAGLEWKPKSPARSAVCSQASTGIPLVSEAVGESPSASPSEDTGVLETATSKLQGLSIPDDQPVIIPDHLQVPEADMTSLSFGSFGADFTTSFSSPFASDDSSKSSVSVEDAAQAEEAVATEEPVVTSLTSSTLETLNEDYSREPTTVSTESIVSTTDVIVRVPVSAVEIPKPEPVVNQIPGTQYSYVTTVPNYPSLGVVPQVPQVVGGQYSYESAESQSQEVPRLPSFVQSYSDPSNFYNPVFRANPDGEVRYPHFVSTNAASKYNGNLTLLTGQSLSSSKEGGNSVVLSTVGATGQTSQTAGIAQATIAVPQQQPLPIHAYPGQPAGVPISPFAANVFGYQYVPPSYTYMHAPYQHSYSGNAGYPQPPTGSSYGPAAGGSYPAVGAAIKYSLPQYKPTTLAANVPHAAVAAGYGSYTAAPSGFAVSPAVTAGSASGYDDVGGPQYKENNLYIPSQQQAEGSAVWVHAQLTRDMTGLQTNSYYNIPAQSQHTGYAHSQSTHAHPVAAYASLYHPPQSGATPNAHQLLQQPQALGTVGAGSAQAGTYQQPQHGQLNWANSY